MRALVESPAVAWAQHSFNLAWGCHQVSPGCANCYAKDITERHHLHVWGPWSTARRTFGVGYWSQPLRWNAQARGARVRRRVFCSPMGDVWEKNPTIDAERAKLWPLIRATPWLDWILLTKRTSRIAGNLPADWGAGYPNVWLGASIENQRWARRLDELLRVPAALHLVSCEPLLGTIDLRPALGRLGWVAVGGESGPRRRPMELAWLERIVADCADAGVPVYVRQDSELVAGSRGRIPSALWRHEFPRREVAA